MFWQSIVRSIEDFAAYLPGSVYEVINPGDTDSDSEDTKGRYRSLRKMPARHLHTTSKPYNLTDLTIAPRGRPNARKTSAERVSQDRRKHRLATRKPLTPTTTTAIAKERKHKQYLKKRAKEAELERILRTADTYWRFLTNGKKYRSFGGTRAR